MSTTTRAAFGDRTGPRAMARAVFGWFGLIPYWLIALTARLALAEVFWSSAQAHLSNWATTLYLFENSYHVPLLPSDLSAYLAVAIELATPPLLVLGLATRFAALVLLGMTLVIEVFIYPQAWPTHIQWAAMLLVLLGRGAGIVSLDAAIRHRILGQD